MEYKRNIPTFEQFTSGSFRNDEVNSSRFYEKNKMLFDDEDEDNEKEEDGEDLEESFQVSEKRIDRMIYEFDTRSEDDDEDLVDEDFDNDNDFEIDVARNGSFDEDNSFIQDGEGNDIEYLGGSLGDVSRDNDMFDDDDDDDRILGGFDSDDDTLEDVGYMNGGLSLEEIAKHFGGVIDTNNSTVRRIHPGLPLRVVIEDDGTSFLYDPRNNKKHQVSSVNDIDNIINSVYRGDMLNVPMGGYTEPSGRYLSSLTESEIKSDDEFREYAEDVLKKAHGENYDEDIADKTIKGLLKKYEDDYGAAIGALTSGFGESLTYEAKLNKEEQKMLDFISDVKGWHSITSDALTIKTAKSLESMGLIELSGGDTKRPQIRLVSSN